MTLVGLDYGSKRIGVALARGSLAEAYTIIYNNADVFVNLQEIFRELQPDTIVIGLSENKMAAATKQFAQTLQNYTAVPIEFVDETLTSHDVHQYLINAPRKIKRAPIDHYAAALILENYLQDHEQNSSS